MSTNYYLFTKNKNAAVRWFGEYKFDITDTPDWGYTAHIAKTSIGWLPLFQAYDNIKSIEDLKKCYNTGLFKIYNEYDELCTWEYFNEYVLNHNGGCYGSLKRELNKITYDIDKDNIPKSHADITDPYFSYFRDSKGYEFTNEDFS